MGKIGEIRGLISELSWTKELKSMNVGKACHSFQPKVQKRPPAHVPSQGKTKPVKITVNVSELVNYLNKVE